MKQLQRIFVMNVLLRHSEILSAVNNNITLLPSLIKCFDLFYCSRNTEVKAFY